jgi:choline dehydrogenase
MRWDWIVVGAGSAGCVVAERLSRDPSSSVLLLEAGPDYPTEDALPPEIRSGLGPSFSHDWGFGSEPGALGRSLPLPRARLVGGCSATNAAMAFWPRREDMADWLSTERLGWSYDDVVPALRELEADTDGRAGRHGVSGPVPIRRFAPQEWLPWHAAFREAAARSGHAVIDDHNAEGSAGVGPIPFNVVDGVRRSAALTHLAPARSRDNLTVRAGAAVDRLILEGHSAVAVVVAGSGEAIEGATVVLSAGSYCSPAVLLRSGLGPADHLRAHGIEVVRDLPGVGAGLADHPLIGLRYVADTPSANLPGAQMMLAASSSTSDGELDLQLFPWTPFEEESSPSGAVFTVFAALMRPHSRGALRLRSRDPSDAPLIDLGYFTDPDDMPRLVEATRLARELAATPPLAAFTGRPLSVAAQPNLRDGDLEGAIRAEVSTYHHPVGTCRSGPPQDPASVVDETGAVKGVESLYVIDASIAPSVPSVNTNLTTLLLAHRLAQRLAVDR